MGEGIHLGRFHSHEVMVVFLIAECASETHSKFKLKFKSTMDRNCYDWLKKYTVIEVVARENGGCARKMGSFDGHNLHFPGHDLGHDHKSSYPCPRS